MQQLKMLSLAAGRNWMGCKRGEILRVPLKTLGIWRKSSAGIDLLIPNCDYKRCMLKTRG